MDLRFFANPPAVAGVVWCGSMFALLIPTCIELARVTNIKGSAKDEVDQAQSGVDQAQVAVNNARAALTEAKQRIVDLDCAITGYPAFNEAISVLYERIRNSTLPALDRLGTVWLLTFSPDKTEDTKMVVGKKFYEQERVYGRYWRCGFLCAKDVTCCYVNDWGWQDVAKYYNEITNIQATYRNILTGSGIQGLPLNCGYYSRRFSIDAPQSYVVSQSPPVSGGDRRSGSVYIQIKQDYGSRVPVRYTLDEQNPTSTITVSNSASQPIAAENLMAQLLQFFATAIAAFNVTGANYPALQESIRNSIPSLESTLAAANNTLVDKNGLLEDKMAVFSHSDKDYDVGMSIWMPIFWGIPIVLALFACCASYQYKKKYEDDGERSSREMTPF